ncbi:helix-turn-helix domain-containing protein [Pedobacter sp. NJ-S-72]
MSTTANRPNKVHEGRNVKRFREMLGIKQDALAYELGGEWSQKRISVLESKEKIEDDVLAEVAKALKVPEDAIRNFDEETAIFNISNNFETAASGSLVVGYNKVGNNNSYTDCAINPIDKWVETLEKLEALQAENKALYERLLQSEKEKVELLRAVK